MIGILVHFKHFFLSLFEQNGSIRYTTPVSEFIFNSYTVEYV